METVQNFDGMLVLDGCYPPHPLVNALREIYDVPVVGVLEASLYTARMLGARFGVIVTSRRGKIVTDDCVNAMGMRNWDVGAENCGIATWDMETRPREEVVKKVGTAAQRLVLKGADVIILGSLAACASTSPAAAVSGTANAGPVGSRERDLHVSEELVVRAAKNAVRDEDGRRLVNVMEGVEAGVWALCGLAGMGCPTSKRGLFASVGDARKARGQEW